MRFEIYLFLAKCIILCTQYNYALAKALVGNNIRPAFSTEFPYIVSIMRIESINLQSEADHMCTGTLVSNKDVVTAGHCLIHEEIFSIQIIVGSVDLRLGTKYFPQWWIFYNDWMRQRNVRSEFEENDIAIIRLTKTIPNSIRYAVISHAPTYTLFGKIVSAAGWGVSIDGIIPRVLETTKLKILSTMECENRIETLHGNKLLVHARYMCTNADPYALLSFGDSGSPVIYENKLLAISLQTCPLANQPFHPEKLNLHLVVDYYKNFISDVKNNL